MAPPQAHGSLRPHRKSEVSLSGLRLLVGSVGEGWYFTVGSFATGAATSMPPSLFYALTNLFIGTSSEGSNLNPRGGLVCIANTDNPRSP